MDLSIFGLIWSKNKHCRTCETFSKCELRIYQSKGFLQTQKEALSLLCCCFFISHVPSNIFVTYALFRLAYGQMFHEHFFQLIGYFKLLSYSKTLFSLLFSVCNCICLVNNLHGKIWNNLQKSQKKIVHTFLVSSQMNLEYVLKCSALKKRAKVWKIRKIGYHNLKSCQWTNMNRHLWLDEKYNFQLNHVKNYNIQLIHCFFLNVYNDRLLCSSEQSSTFPRMKEYSNIDSRTKCVIHIIIMIWKSLAFLP